MQSAQPVFFGPAQRPLFGWLHTVKSPAPPALGLVLCNPFGYEAVCAHRTFRHLAATANAAGVPAIRFDYDGTGDSAGNDLLPDRINAWVDSIHRAVETLRSATGVERVCLLGIRLGALLASIAAYSRPDVAALIAIAPVVKARSYVRELRAFNASLAASAASEADVLEAAGFLMTRATTESLQAIDLSADAQSPAADVLIVDRKDFPTAARWSERLQASGTRVTRESMEDYGCLTAPPHSMDLPRRTMDIAMSWLGALAGRAAGTGEPTAPLQDSTQPRDSIVLSEDGMPSVRESVVFLDRERRLFAIVSSPEDVKTQSRTGILLLNAGATHHIGSDRLYVELARKWVARAGCVVARLDITGIGDSPPESPEKENVVYPGHGTRDVRTAIETLQQTWDLQSIAAVGLCSGAYHAFTVAAGAVPLATAVLINPLTFYWKEGMTLEEDANTGFVAEVTAQEAARLRGSALRPEVWRKLFSGKADLRNAFRVATRSALDALRGLKREALRRAGVAVSNDLAGDLRRILARGTRVSFIFSAQDLGLQRLNLQGGKTVPRLLKRGRIALHLVPGADHTFTQLRHRRQLITLLEGALWGEGPQTIGAARTKTVPVDDPVGARKTAST